MNVLQKSLSIGIVAAGIGCASAPLPQERLSSTEASVRAAQELGAQQVPRAKLHLQLASEELAKAHKLAKDGDDDLGTLQLDRARADAELAIALSREATVQRDLQQLGGGSPNNKPSVANAQGTQP
jgi:hypothetical protein